MENSAPRENNLRENPNHFQEVGLIRRSNGGIDGPFLIIRDYVDPNRKVLIFPEKEGKRVAIKISGEGLNLDIAVKKVSPKEVISAEKISPEERQNNILVRLIDKLTGEGLNIGPEIVYDLFSPKEEKFQLRVKEIHELLKEKGLNEEKISKILSDYYRLRTAIILHQENQPDILENIRKILYFN